MRISVLLLSLLLLFSTSFALSLTDIPLVLPVVIVIVAGVLAIAYSLSQTLNRPQLHAWVKTELRELVVAAILFAIVIGFFSGGAQSIIFLITGEADYYVGGKEFVSDMKTVITDSYSDLTKVFHSVGMRAAFSTNIAFPIFYSSGTVGGSPSSGFGAFFTFLSPAASNLTNTLFFYTALEVLLDFFHAVGYNLIYLAFAFRFIPFTRQLGSTLVALVIGAYVIYPFSLVLVKGFHNVIDVPSPNVPASVFDELEFIFPPGAYFVCNEWWIRVIVATLGEYVLILPICIPISIASLGVLWEPCNWLVAIIYNILILAMTLVWAGMVLASTFVSPNIAPVFEGLKPFLSDVTGLVVVSVIDAIIISVITIVGVKSISSALGGEYMLPGVQKMVG
ncbi:hypothetical protein J4450_01765 [Candidatus Micrarchaeota archaeon]|nr:hypothetical protein [Candidatus Micrarchaeota archaeon]